MKWQEKKYGVMERRGRGGERRGEERRGEERRGEERRGEERRKKKGFRKCSVTSKMLLLVL